MTILPCNRISSYWAKTPLQKHWLRSCTRLLFLCVRKQIYFRVQLVGESPKNSKEKPNQSKQVGWKAWNVLYWWINYFVVFLLNECQDNLLLRQIAQLILFKFSCSKKYLARKFFFYLNTSVPFKDRYSQKRSGSRIVLTLLKDLLTKKQLVFLSEHFLEFLCSTWQQIWTSFVAIWMKLSWMFFCNYLLANKAR